MMPAGHLLSGYVAGTLAGALLAERRGRLMVTAIGVVGGIAPDFDVIFGLLGGYAEAGLHRGLTHSLLGALGFGLLAALVFPRLRAVAFAAGAGGAKASSPSNQ